MRRFFTVCFVVAIMATVVLGAASCEQSETLNTDNSEVIKNALCVNMQLSCLEVYGSTFSSYLGKYDTQTDYDKFLSPLKKVEFTLDQSDVDEYLCSELNKRYAITPYVDEAIQSYIYILSDGSVELFFNRCVYKAPAGSVDWNYYSELQPIV